MVSTFAGSGTSWTNDGDAPFLNFFVRAKLMLMLKALLMLLPKEVTESVDKLMIDQIEIFEKALRIVYCRRNPFAN
jgi:hypothetical protein